MKNYLTIFFLLFAAHGIAQTVDVQFFSENQEPFYLSINGQKVSSTADNNHTISGLFYNQTYDVFIDYMMPTTSDVKTKLMLNNNTNSTQLIFMIPQFFQGSLINKTEASTAGNNMGDMSINMNVNENGFNISMNTNQSHNTQITPLQNNDVSNQQSTHQSNSSHTNTPQTQIVYVPGYSGSVGCEVPVNSSRFEDMMASVEDASFAEDKVRVCKRILNTNCLTVEHLVMMLEEITFDEDQLVLAKFAYEHVYDLENYYKVYAVFSFSNSGEELEQYIESK